MSLLNRLFDEETVIYECRACGQKLDRNTKICPNCDSEEIGIYHLP